MMEPWVGYTEIKKISELGFTAIAAFDNVGAEFYGKTFETREGAENDLPELKDVAETYATRHGAVIEWEDAK